MAIQISGTQVISDTQGLTNIASVDATTAASISAAGVGGGGTYDFVASGAIASGDVVILNSNGTVSVVGSTSQTESLGSITVFNTSRSDDQAAVYDPVNNKVVVFFSDEGDSYKGKAVVGSISGTTLTFGTPVQFDTQVYVPMGATYDSVSGKIVLGYASYNGSLHACKSIVGTVSGTSISFGTATTIYSSTSTAHVDAVYDSSNDKTVIFFSATSVGLRSVVGTVSGTSISFGSIATVTSNFSAYFNSCFDSSNNKVVVSYNDSNDTENGKSAVGTVSGTSISFGSIATFDTGTIRFISSVFDTDTNKVIITYQDYSPSGVQGQAIVGTVSGTSISFGTVATFEGTTYGASYIGAAYDPSVQKINIFYAGTTPASSAYGRYVTGTVSGTSLSFGTSTVLSSAGSFFGHQNCATFDSGSNRVFFSFRDGTNSQHGSGRVLRNAGNVSNNSSWIGVSTEAIADTATGTVTVFTGVNEQQTGLTTGSKYYVAGDGSLTTSGSVPIGKALSATKLLIDEGNA